MHVGMAEFYRERNDLDAATQHLLRSQELGEPAGFPQNPYRWRVAMARIREAEGDLEGALDLLHEAERRYVSDFSPKRASHRGVQGAGLDRPGEGKRRPRLGAGAGTGRFGRPQLPPRVRAHHPGAATHRPLSERPGQSASSTKPMACLPDFLPRRMAGERAGSVIEILILQALAHEAKGDIPGGLVAAASAPSTMAEPEGYVRLFVGEGAPMARLLSEAARPGDHAGLHRQVAGRRRP